MKQRLLILLASCALLTTSAVIGSLLFMVNLGSQPLYAAKVGATDSTITVTTTDDELNGDGDCALREAIQAANTNRVVDACPAGGEHDTIDLPPGVYGLTLDGGWTDFGESGDLDIMTGTVTISGSVAGPSIVDGNQIDRVLHIGAGATVTLTHLTIRNGRPPNPVWCGSDEGNLGGGGILNEGNLVITHSTIHANSSGEASQCVGMSSGHDGGGIFNNGSLTVINSTISGNTAEPGDCITHTYTGGCGGNGAGAGIANTGMMTLLNSTIAGNFLGEQRCVTFHPPSGPQLACNKAGIGGGIFNKGAVWLRNTIVAGNGVAERHWRFDGTGKPYVYYVIVHGDDCSGCPLISEGYNLVQVVPGCDLIGTTNGNIVGRAANLAPLGDYGGPTLTHALFKVSPAIDAASCTDSQLRPVTTDQRGLSRPQRHQCDIGAYETTLAEPFNYGFLPMIRTNVSAQ